MAMHPSAIRQLVCSYSICLLDVYLVCHGGGQPISVTSVHMSQSMHLRAHVYYTFFLVLVGTITSQNIRHFFFNPCILFFFTTSYPDYSPEVHRACYKMSTGGFPRR